MTSIGSMQPWSPDVVGEAWHPRIALGYFALKTLLLYPPHAMVKRLHGRDVILIPETADLLGL